MRYAGKVNLGAIEHGFSVAKPGVSLLEVDAAIEQFILKHDCKPAFKNYQPIGASSPFLFSACLSPNDTVVHGVPGNYILKDGDLLTIDVGTAYKGWFVDAARTRITSGTNLIGLKLIEATEAVLEAQLNVIKHGCNLWALVQAADDAAKKHNISILPQWGGHGIANEIHMEPFIPNAISSSNGHLYRRLQEMSLQKLKFIEGNTYCIEPVCTYGTIDTYMEQDNWSIKTIDKTLAAHTERCIMVLKDGVELLS